MEGDFFLFCFQSMKVGDIARQIVGPLDKLLCFHKIPSTLNSGI